MADCSILETPSPLECAVYRDSATCTATGCGWCSNRICMSPQIVASTIDCVMPDLPPFAVEGEWRYTTWPCTASTCLPAVVSRVIDIWNGTDAMQTIASLPWPELGPMPVGASGAVFIRVAQGSADGWLGVRSQQLSIVSSPESWAVVYPDESWEPSPWLLEGTPLQLVTVSGELVCIASSRMDPLVQLQIFGLVQQPLLAVLPVSAGLCGTYRLDTDVFYDETGEYGLSIGLAWIANASVAHIVVTDA